MFHPPPPLGLAYGRGQMWAAAPRLNLHTGLAAGFGLEVGLRGANRNDLPVQFPMRFELVINLDCEGARPDRATIGF